MNRSEDLQMFLADKIPFHETEALWADGTMPLRVCYFRSDEQPSEQFVTSVRCLVFQNDSILVLRNRKGNHILPGGRREEGETFEQTLRREVAEETGWTVESISRLGFIHLKHLKPKPPGYQFLHPHFFQIVYTARASKYVPDLMCDDDYEEESTFVPIGELDGLGISEAELGYVRYIKSRAHQGLLFG